jgi:hypothetical protein
VIDPVAKDIASSTMMAPWSMPTRNSMRLSAGTPALLWPLSDSNAPVQIRHRR